MILGFTGTRDGHTAAQLRTFARLLLELRPDTFHHGDCVGADAEAHRLVHNAVAELKIGPCRIEVHPPLEDEHRAYCLGDYVHPPRTHFARNRKIVDACELLIGVSKTPERSERGGTWYTIDYAKKRGKPVRVIWPDGSEGAP